MPNKRVKEIQEGRNYMNLGSDLIVRVFEFGRSSIFSKSWFKKLIFRPIIRTKDRSSNGVGDISCIVKYRNICVSENRNATLHRVPTWL